MQSPWLGIALAPKHQLPPSPKESSRFTPLQRLNNSLLLTFSSSSCDSCQHHFLRRNPSTARKQQAGFCSLSLSLFLFVCFFRATPLAYGSSQAWDQIRATAAGLHHSHSNIRPEPCPQPTPQLKAMPNP